MPLEEADLQQVTKLMEDVLNQRESQLGEDIDRRVGKSMEGVKDVLQKLVEAGNSSQPDAQQGQNQDQGNQMIMQLLPIVLTKLLGGGQPAETDFTKSMTQMENFMAMGEKMFLNRAMSNMQVGMDLTAKAFGYHARVNGEAPDPQGFIDHMQGKPVTAGDTPTTGLQANLEEEIKRLAALD